ncbi:hypothetical protein DFH28DRAFT_433480 [Melampsora americana]|nr:hypothetical protein DFH28DRAFT_433480 [Melampsora americana]
MSLMKHLVVLSLFFYAYINCRGLSKREFKRPMTAWGEVFCAEVDEVNNEYPYDETKKLKVLLQDLHTTPEKPHLETHGFTYVSGRNVKGVENLTKFSDIHKAFLTADSIQLVRELTKEKLAIPYAPAFRDFTGPFEPFPVIHSDISPEGAKFFRGILQEQFLTTKNQRVVQFGKYLEEGKQIAVYNVWRPIHVVKDNPLGLCKWDSLLPEDALPSKIKPTNADNAIQAWNYREGQEWFYLNEQRPDEVYVFKQHDDRAQDGHGINVPHASFSLVEDQDKVSSRISFECRVIVIVD